MLIKNPQSFKGRTHVLVHTLKTVNPYFEDVLNQHKMFEVRKNDRDFQVGDFLILQEYDSKREVYLGRKIKCVITYILNDESVCKKGFVVLGIMFIGWEFEEWLVREGA